MSKLEQLDVDCALTHPPHMTHQLDSSDTVAESAPVIEHNQLNTIQRPCMFCLRLGYENLSLEQTLHEALPTQVAPVSGFSIMGHVAHFNLKPDALPYRRLIGECLPLLNTGHNVSAFSPEILSATVA